MFVHPFELRARLEYIKAGRHGYWINEEPYWLATITERAAGLPPSAYLPVEIDRHYTREDAQVFASHTFAGRGIKAKWHKLPKRKQVSRLDDAVMGRARGKQIKGEQHDTQTIQRT